MCERKEGILVSYEDRYREREKKVGMKNDQLKRVNNVK